MRPSRNTCVDRTLRDSFISLVRLGIGRSTNVLPEIVDWQAVQTLAIQEGLASVVLDGIEISPVKNRPPKEFLLNWIGATMQEEQRYAIQWKTASELALFLKKESIGTYVLKGFTIAECYPKPSHRCSTDLDCFLKSDIGNSEIWEIGNFIIEQSGVKVDRNYYKNSTWYLPGLMVENHRWFTPFRGNKRLTKLEQLFQGMIIEDGGNDQIEGTWLNRPPVMLTALFLIEHAYSHFLHEGLNWRHVLDWMMFSKKHQKEIDWPQFEEWIDNFGFREFYTSYYNLGKYLQGEIEEEDLTAKDKLMLADVWAPLDFHETVDGLNGKLNLASNTWRAGWKYREFTDMSWIRALWIQVKGFMFIKEPKL